MAVKCKDCGDDLKFATEIANGNLCVNCGPGSAKDQMRRGSTIPNHVNRGVPPQVAAQIDSHNARVMSGAGPAPARSRVLNPDAPASADATERRFANVEVDGVVAGAAEAPETTSTEVVAKDPWGLRGLIEGLVMRVNGLAQDVAVLRQMLSIQVKLERKSVTTAPKVADKNGSEEVAP